MKFTETPIVDAFVIEPVVHQDHRGFFVESYSQARFQEHGLQFDFVQDNHSMSVEAGVLRGLHYQAPPHAQTKLVRVTAGAVFDVIVDIRKGSPSYGRVFSVELSAQNAKMLLAPQGVAHGFYTLEPNTEFLYKVDDVYDRDSEGGIFWNDPSLGIEWPGADPILSDKDKVLPKLSEFDSPFIYERRHA